MITPASRREFGVYPTRSLQVWSVASIVRKLGFKIAASPQLVSSVEDYTRFCTPNRLETYPDTILVVGMVGKTDPLLLRHIPTPKTAILKPQLTPVRGVPWLAFRHLRSSRRKVNTQYLVEVRHYSYQKAREMEAYVIPGEGRITIQVSCRDRVHLSDLQRNLIRAWPPHLIQVCGPALVQFVPFMEDQESWSLDGLIKRFQEMHAGHDLLTTEEQLQDNCYVLISLLLGTMYGIICACTFENNFRQMDLDSQIAFQLQMISGYRLSRLADAIGRGINGTLNYTE